MHSILSSQVFLFISLLPTSLAQYVGCPSLTSWSTATVAPFTNFCCPGTFIYAGPSDLSCSYKHTVIDATRHDWIPVLYSLDGLAIPSGMLPGAGPTAPSDGSAGTGAAATTSAPTESTSAGEMSTVSSTSSAEAIGAAVSTIAAATSTTLATSMLTGQTFGSNAGIGNSSSMASVSTATSSVNIWSTIQPWTTAQTCGSLAANFSCVAKTMTSTVSLHTAGMSNVAAAGIDVAPMVMCAALAGLIVVV